MRELLNEETRRYVSDYTGLSGEYLSLVGHAVYLTATTEKAPSMNRLSSYTGVGYPTLHREIEAALTQAYHGKLHDLRHDFVWKMRPDAEKLFYGLAAGLISRGLWLETEQEPEWRIFARDWLNGLCPMELMQTKAAFCGYLILLEYLWCAVKAGGIELKPADWMRVRYGSGTNATKNLRAFFTTVAEHASELCGAGYQVSDQVFWARPTMILDCLQVKLQEDLNRNVVETCPGRTYVTI